MILLTLFRYITCIRRQSVAFKRQPRVAMSRRGESKDLKKKETHKYNRVAAVHFLFSAQSGVSREKTKAGTLRRSLSLSLSLSLSFSQKGTLYREALFHLIQSLCLHRAEVDGPLIQFFKWIADAACDSQTLSPFDISFLTHTHAHIYVHIEI